MAPFVPPVLTPFAAVWAARAQFLGAVVLWFERPEKGTDMYNVLWVLVFGFATLNILSLGARKMDSSNRMNFGEVLAVLVVVVAVILLGSELLHMFKIFPIHLRSR